MTNVAVPLGRKTSHTAVGLPDMLTDSWVIAQLVAQSCGLLLMLGVGKIAWQMLRSWDSGSATATQLKLERQSYLVDTMVRSVLFFQLLNLVLFLFTINTHFAALIEGAMCGTGTLGLNGYGYPALYVKLGSVFLYLSFLFIHHLDSREPELPLTPFKYIFLFPILLLIGIDLYLFVQYVSHIEPDIIATCCSVSVLLTDRAGGNFLSTGAYTGYSVIAFINLFFILAYLLLFGAKRRLLLLFLGLLYTGLAVYSLKFFFVSYIYGLPSHNCLFDLFFAQHHFVGFALFGSYYGLLGGVLSLFWLRFFRPLLSRATDRLARNLRYWSLAFLVLSFLIPIAYRMAWGSTVL